MNLEIIFFWILAIISIGASVWMVATKNPVRSALFLVLTFLCMAVFYILLSAQFIAAVQVIVYAGAIMVLFLFVIMLLNLGPSQKIRETGGLQVPVAVGLGLAFVLALFGSQSFIAMTRPAASPAVYQPLGTTEAIGYALYSPGLPWLFPFEITSILLLVAVVGAIIMAKRQI